MIKNSIVFGLSASLLAGSAFAGMMGPIERPWNWVGSVSLGPAWDNGGHEHTFYLTPTIEKTYTAHRTRDTVFEGELFAGIQAPLTALFFGQVGLAVAADTNAKLSGMIWDDADPVFNNYSYRYDIQHTHIALKGKLFADAGYLLTPWVSVGLGLGFNSAGSFRDVPLIYEAVPTPHFKSNTQTAFTYTLGAGVQKAIYQHWQVGVGYEYADWGKSRLGRATGQVLNSGLKLSHLYTNGLLFSLSYTA